MMTLPCAAQIKGVSPSGSMALGGVPFFSRRFVRTASPLLAASKRDCRADISSLALDVEHLNSMTDVGAETPRLSMSTASIVSVVTDEVY